MANFKHKVFLLIAKWIPVAVAAGILINNTLAMLDVKDVILDLFDITVGSSLAFVIMMYACSYVFNFCYWHKIVIPNATNNEIEDKIIEATISNWFEDEDASSDKVWEYFRVI